MVGQTTPQQLRQMANVFLSHRRMGEAEAVYRVTPDMHLSESNAKCVFVITGFPESRYEHAIKVSDNINDPRYVDDPTIFEIDDRRGLYKESVTLLKKYQRRGVTDNLDKLSYAQFCQQYEPHRKASKPKNVADNLSSGSEEDHQENNTSHVYENDAIEENSEIVPFDDRIHTANDDEIYKLPDLIKLTEVCPGEAPYMKRRKMPNALRLHKARDKNSHEGLYSMLILFHPFQKESIDLKEAKDDNNVCKEMFLFPESIHSIAENEDALRNSNILKIRKKIMPFIEDVQEVREHISEMDTARIAEQIDAENVQDNEDCDMVGPEIHPDFEVQHPDFFQGNPQHPIPVSSYTRIVLWDTAEIRAQIRTLDEDQRYLIDTFVKYVRMLRLAYNGFCPFPTPPLYVVEGDAGCEK